MKNQRPLPQEDAKKGKIMNNTEQRKYISIPNFTRGLAQEWAEHGITVNAVGPGMFPSEMMNVDAQTEQFLAFRAPIGRAGKVEELCGQILLFASEINAYTTGQTIYIDGGITSV